MQRNTFMQKILQRDSGECCPESAIVDLKGIIFLTFVDRLMRHIVGNSCDQPYMHLRAPLLYQLFTRKSLGRLAKLIKVPPGEAAHERGLGDA